VCCGHDCRFLEEFRAAGNFHTASQGHQQQNSLEDECSHFQSRHHCKDDVIACNKTLSFGWTIYTHNRLKKGNLDQPIPPDW
jgi:hypothetical protein